MLVMTKGTFPFQSSKQVGETFLKAMEKPLTRSNLIGTWLGYGGEGIEFWSIYELEKGHEEEGRMELVEAEVLFYDIEGYKVDIINVMSPEDALTLVGMSLPS